MDRVSSAHQESTWDCLLPHLLPVLPLPSYPSLPLLYPYPTSLFPTRLLPLSSLPVSPSSPTRPPSLSSTRLLPLLLPVSSLFSYPSPLSPLPVPPSSPTRPPSSLPVPPSSLPVLPLSSPTRPLPSQPDLSPSISCTLPRPEIAKMGRVEGERRLVMCESLWVLPF